MKNYLKIVSIALIGLIISACTLTPSQGIALANAEAGNATATYLLGKEGKSAEKGLQDLAAALPQIPYGKVSANQLGVINGELQNIQNQVSSSSNSKLFSQVGSLIALVSQGANQGGGNPTAEQGILSAQLADVAQGITNAIAFYEGQISVNPPVTTTTSSLKK